MAANDKAPDTGEKRGRGRPSTAARSFNEALARAKARRVEGLPPLRPKNAYEREARAVVQRDYPKANGRPIGGKGLAAARNAVELMDWAGWSLADAVRHVATEHNADPSDVRKRIKEVRQGGKLTLHPLPPSTALGVQMAGERVMAPEFACEVPITPDATASATFTTVMEACEEWRLRHFPSDVNLDSIPTIPTEAEIWAYAQQATRKRVDRD